MRAREAGRGHALDVAARPEAGLVEGLVLPQVVLLEAHARVRHVAHVLLRGGRRREHALAQQAHVAQPHFLAQVAEQRHLRGAQLGLRQREAEGGAHVLQVAAGRAAGGVTRVRGATAHAREAGAHLSTSSDAWPSKTHTFGGIARGRGTVGARAASLERTTVAASCTACSCAGSCARSSASGVGGAPARVRMVDDQAGEASTARRARAPTGGIRARVGGRDGICGTLLLGERQQRGLCRGGRGGSRGGGGAPS